MAYIPFEAEHYREALENSEIAKRHSVYIWRATTT